MSTPFQRPHADERHENRLNTSWVFTTRLRENSWTPGPRIISTSIDAIRRVLFAVFLVGTSLGWAPVAMAQDQQDSENNSFDSSSANSIDMLIVVGAGGSDEYESDFHDSVNELTDALNDSHVAVQVIGLADSDEFQTDLDRLERQLSEFEADGDRPLWLLLVGHGTFDGRVAKFNLRGPDLSSEQLAEWLKDFSRPLVVTNCSSASAPFLNAISGSNRIIVTATRSGNELNYSRFGGFFVTALVNSDADLDKDGQTSLLEAFLYASARVNEFYEADSRLISEHALLDDNGDKRGTPADWYEGTRVVKTDQDATIPDGPRAHQLHLMPSDFESRFSSEQIEERNRLEMAIEQLRLKKADMDEADYLLLLDGVVSQLAALYESVDLEQTDVQGSPAQGVNETHADPAFEWLHSPVPDVRPPLPTDSMSNQP